MLTLVAEKQCRGGVVGTARMVREHSVFVCMVEVMFGSLGKQIARFAQEDKVSCRDDDFLR